MRNLNGNQNKEPQRVFGKEREEIKNKTSEIIIKCVLKMIPLIFVCTQRKIISL